MEPAPYHAEVTTFGEGEAFWLEAEDGVRIRLGLWRAEAPRGTMLMFPGRTEFVEKYAHVAAEMTARGFDMIAVDWRGQGLADRLHPNPLTGHVDDFADYQRDVTAVMAAVSDLGLARPWHVVGHSMGGCIGLRALIDGRLDVATCGFTAPMWGISMAPALRPVAWGLSTLSRPFGFSSIFAPGQKPAPYVQRADFETNTLTSDREMYERLRHMVTEVPGLGLGGPSLHWLRAALVEMRALDRLPSPDLPCLTFCGEDEMVVDKTRIARRMARWPNGELEWIAGGRHELFLETPEIRGHVIARLTEHFETAPARAAA